MNFPTIVYLEIYTARLNEYIQYKNDRELGATIQVHDKGMPDIIFENVTLKDGTRAILDNVSVEFNHGNNYNKGRIYQVEGTNGSGKSCLMRIISGSLRPDSGIIRYPRPVQQEQDNFIRRICVNDIFVPSNASLIKDVILSPQDLKSITNEIRLLFKKGVLKSEAQEIIKQYLARAEHILTSDVKKKIADDIKERLEKAKEILNDENLEQIISNLAESMLTAKIERTTKLLYDLDQGSIINDKIEGKSDGQLQIIKFVQLLVSFPAPKWIILDEAFSNITIENIKMIQELLRKTFPYSNIIQVDHYIGKDIPDETWPIFETFWIVDSKIEKEKPKGALEPRLETTETIPSIICYAARGTQTLAIEERSRRGQSINGMGSLSSMATPSTGLSDRASRTSSPVLVNTGRPSPVRACEESPLPEYLLPPQAVASPSANSSYARGIYPQTPEKAKQSRELGDAFYRALREGKPIYANKVTSSRQSNTSMAVS